MGKWDTSFPLLENKKEHADWWEPGDKDDEEHQVSRSNGLLACARYLENVQSELHQQNLWNAQLYSNRELAAFDWGQGALYRASLAPVSRVSENLVAMVVDTMVAMIGKNRPKATPVPRGASWKLRRQARRLDKFLYGEFIRNRVYDIGKRVFRDACIFGFGVVHVRVDDEAPGGPRTCVERVFPDEILIDQSEVVATGYVRHLYRRRVLPVEVIAAMFGTDEDELRAAAEQYQHLEHRPVGKGWAVLVQAWQKDGRYVAAVKGLPPLRDEEWKAPEFPFVFYHYQDPVSGFYSPSAVEQALNYQIRLNEVNEVIREAQDLMARPRIFVAEGSRVSPSELDNRIGRIIKYTGIKPEPSTWQAVSAELYNERDRVVQTCLTQFGLNGSSVSGQMPAGFRADSSAAVREYNAINDDRQADPAQRYERFYLDVAERIVQVIRASGVDVKTTWYSGGRKARAETIDWSQINLEEQAYVLQLEASSIFNLTPAAMRDELEKQLAQGLISPEDYRRELANPDLESEASIQAAAAEDIEATIEELEDGKRPKPTPAQDLKNGVKRVSLAHLRAKRYEDCPPEVLKNMLDWLAAARSWLRRAADTSGSGMPGSMPSTPAPAGPAGMPANGLVPQEAVMAGPQGLIAPPPGGGPLL
jgi:hypothetical protein